MSASTKKKKKNGKRKRCSCFFSWTQTSLAVRLRANGSDALLPLGNKKNLNAITNPWPDGQKRVSVPTRCHVCLRLREATLRQQVCSHSLTSQISESRGGSFLSWSRRANTCSEWTLLSVRRLTSFISIRGNIKWSWGNIWSEFNKCYHERTWNLYNHVGRIGRNYS